MDGACGSVSLDRYWNYVATPFLFTILGFGMYTLFGMNEMQLVGRSYVMKQVDKIGTAMGSDSAPPPEKDVASEAAAVAKEILTPKLGKEIANSTNAALDKRRKAAEAAGRKSNAAAAAAAAAAAPAPAPAAASASAPAAPPPAKQ